MRGLPSSVNGKGGRLRREGVREGCSVTRSGGGAEGRGEGRDSVNAVDSVRKGV